MPLQTAFLLLVIMSGNKIRKESFPKLTLIGGVNLKHSTRLMVLFRQKVNHLILRAKKVHLSHRKDYKV